jgi:hypothetical protein
MSIKRIPKPFPIGDYEFAINSKNVIVNEVSHPMHHCHIKGDLKEMVEGLVFAMEADKKVLELVTNSYKSFIENNK